MFHFGLEGIGPITIYCGGIVAFLLSIFWRREVALYYLVLLLPLQTWRYRLYEYPLGPHTPRMRPQDLELMHKVWLDITSDPRYAGAHHYHVVAVALEELQRELNSPDRGELLAKLLDEMHKDHPPGQG